MSFGLRNFRATYQRLVNAMFSEQIGRNIEVYVDEIVVNSKRVHDHEAYLEESFAITRAYGMRLNPTKCVFGVEARKFIKFLVHQRGNEANPEKKSKPRSIWNHQEV